MPYHSKPKAPKMPPKQDSPFDDLKEGSLRRQLKIPAGKKIPRSLLRKIKDAPIGSTVEGFKVTKLLKQRATFAFNFAK